MKNTDTRSYPFAIAAGGMQLMPIAGEKFIIESATGPVDITWQDGKVLGRQAGQGANVRGGFSQLILNNSGAGAISGVIAVLDDDAIDNRIAGTVSVSGGTNYTNTAPAVTTGSTALVAANAARKYLYVENNHATGTIYLNFSAAATVGNGKKISPGGYYETPALAPHLGAVNVIGDVANNAVIVLEG